MLGFYSFFQFDWIDWKEGQDFFQKNVEFHANGFYIQQNLLTNFDRLQRLSASHSDISDLRFFENCLMKLNIRKYAADGPAVVILHGLLGSSQNWHSAATKLSEKFQILVPDQRNHGDSPHGAHTIERLSEDVLNLLNQQNINKTFLIGHSMGGLAGMSLFDRR